MKNIVKLLTIILLFVIGQNIQAQGGQYEQISFLEEGKIKLYVNTSEDCEGTKYKKSTSFAHISDIKEFEGEIYSFKISDVDFTGTHDIQYYSSEINGGFVSYFANKNENLILVAYQNTLYLLSETPYESLDFCIRGYYGKGGASLNEIKSYLKPIVDARYKEMRRLKAEKLEAYNKSPEKLSKDYKESPNYPALLSAISYYAHYTNDRGYDRKLFVSNISDEAIAVCMPLFVKKGKELGIDVFDAVPFYKKNPTKDLLVEREALAQDILFEQGFIEKKRFTKEQLYAEIKDGKRPSHKKDFFGDKVGFMPVVLNLNGRESGEKGAEVEMFVDIATDADFKDNYDWFKVEIRYRYEDDLEWTIIKKFVNYTGFAVKEYQRIKDHQPKLVIGVKGNGNGDGGSVKVHYTKLAFSFVQYVMTNLVKNQRAFAVFTEYYFNKENHTGKSGSFELIEDDDILFDW